MITNFKNRLAPAVIELNQMNEELQEENKLLKSENEELKSKNTEDYIRYQRKTQEQAKRIANKCREAYLKAKKNRRRQK